ncbi:MAG: M28 family peptidase [Terrisporobacter sp.]
MSIQNSNAFKNKYNSNNNLVININEISSTINYLSRSVRNSQSKGNLNAANFIKDKLDDYGYEVDIEKFNIYKRKGIDDEVNRENFFNLNADNLSPIGNSFNIIAKNRFFDVNKKIIYVTAHFDTTSDTTGIIDNATGVAVVLELARTLQNNNGEINIMPIFFGAEELGLIGSRNFTLQLSDDEKEKILGCINFDMLGDINGEISMHIHSKEGSKILDPPYIYNNENDNELSVMLNEELNIKKSIGYLTDDLPLHYIGIPTITIMDEHPNHEIDYIDVDKGLSLLDLNRITAITDKIRTFLINY